MRCFFNAVTYCCDMALNLDFILYAEILVLAQDRLGVCPAMRRRANKPMQLSGGCFKLSMGEVPDPPRAAHSG